MKIALLGDIALFGSFDIKTNPGVISNLKKVADYLSTFDYVVANLESPFSKRCKKGGAKSAYLFSNPENIKVLSSLHVNAVNLANNHMLDYGRESFNLTKQLLIQNAIEYFGVDGRVVEVIRDGNKLLLDGFCCFSTNPLGLVDYGKNGINRLEVRQVDILLSKAKQNGFLPLLSIHAGIEHVHTPSVDNIWMSRHWAEIAPYIYYGHHPHVMQGSEKYKDSLIAHSLGNFIFDDNEHVILSDDNRSSAILEIELENNSIKSYHFTPIHITKGNIDIQREEISQYEDNSILFETAISDPVPYMKERNALRQKWIDDRKKNRDLKWYLKRLTPRYVELWFTNRMNAKHYVKYVKKQLSKSLYEL